MIRLRGIRVENFAHPDDTGVNRLFDRLKVNAVVEWLSSVETKLLLKAQLLGKYIGINETEMPGLYNILREVCETLDFAPVPRLFVCRRVGFDYELYIDDDGSVIMLNDYVLNSFDDGMLRYYLGCAVTCLKGKNAHLRVAVGFAGPLLEEVPVIGPVAPAILATLVRKTVLTEDRGGLLACQDIHAAMRTQMFMAGLPPKEFDPAVLSDYMIVSDKSAMLVEAMQFLQGISRETPWQNDRIIALAKWVFSGEYAALMDRYR